MSEFRIVPGMSCWSEMPKKYKEEYFNSLPKILSLYEKNQQKLEKIWLRVIKEEKRIEKSWLNWME